MRVSGAAVLKSVRDKMRENSLAALIIPSSDAHNSEYVAPHLQCRSFITNFKGSSGTAVVTMDNALLWTDGRYWLQAADTMYTEFELMKQGVFGIPTVEEWIISNLGKDAAIGLNPYVVTVAEWERMSGKINLQAAEDFVGSLMAPEKNPQKIYVRPNQFCGATCLERREAVLAEAEKLKCNMTILSALDEIAWFTNLRGGDVPCNPVFYSYVIIDKENSKSRCYVNLDKVTDEVRDTCAEYVEFFPYEQFKEDVRNLPATSKALVDERQTSEAVFQLLKEAGVETVRVVCGPAQKLKGVKNEVELQGFRDCHIRDGAALTRYLAWLHDQIAVQNVTDLNEYDGAAKLEQLRSQNEHFVQLSFESISSTGPNAAMCHYSPAPTGSAVIRKDQLYLIDSGAQYWDGTTDVTRTICFDTPRPEEVEAYTLVLKGHIAINTVAFPKATLGNRLDVLARHALWQVGLDYSHGTGHGVGSFLNVHEGPHGIGIREVATGATMDLHSIVSNEPGYYKDNHFGIRIENLEEVVPRPTKYSPDGFLGLSYLTMAPLCRDLIDVDALTAAEREWVNTYHSKVVENIMPFLEKADDHTAIAYLNHHTQSI